MRYAVARYNEYQRKTAYRIYISDCLRMITENTAKASSGNYITMRYADMIDNKPIKEIKPGDAKSAICKKLREEAQPLESI